VLGSYSLITQNFEVMPYMFFILGMVFLITGSVELKAKRKTSAIISILATLFILFELIDTLVENVPKQHFSSLLFYKKLNHAILLRCVFD